MDDRGDVSWPPNPRARGGSGYTHLVDGARLGRVSLCLAFVLSLLFSFLSVFRPLFHHSPLCLSPLFPHLIHSPYPRRYLMVHPTKRQERALSWSAPGLVSRSCVFIFSQHRSAQTVRDTQARTRRLGPSQGGGGTHRHDHGSVWYPARSPPTPPVRKGWPGHEAWPSLVDLKIVVTEKGLATHTV